MVRCMYFDLTYLGEGAPTHPAFPEAWDAFRKLVETLQAMELEGRGVQMAALVEHEAKALVAFRFTSDAAHDELSKELFAVGGSFGRGKWQPFEDKWQFDNWLKSDGSPAEAKANAPANVAACM